MDDVEADQADRWAFPVESRGRSDAVAHSTGFDSENVADLAAIAVDQEGVLGASSAARGKFQKNNKISSEVNSEQKQEVCTATLFAPCKFLSFYPKRIYTTTYISLESSRDRLNRFQMKKGFQFGSQFIRT